MVVTGELDEQVATGRPTSETDGRHGRLGAGGDEAQFLHRSHTVDDQFRQFGLGRGRGAEGQAARRGILHRPDRLRMRVPENRRTP